MTEWLILLLALVAIISLYCHVADWPDLPGIAMWSIVVILTWTIWHTRDTPEESAAKAAKEAAERKARETPHVIREADGCKVYAFVKGDREHFFTRCPVTTDTERTWEESCGKNCKRQMSEHIMQENK